MKLLIKVALIFLIFFWSSIQLVQKIEDLGKQLIMLGNLPHRGLGMLYLAHIMQPHREDYAKEYYTQWLQTQMNNTMLEGSRKPVVANQIILAYHLKPEDKELRLLAALAFRLEADRRKPRESKEVK